ncbi:MAG: twin-arginine translocase TatA/TatE family subunit [Verrucomicrobiota bacterium]|nr:twin-arginine translocase TatA/TatE family subunit [Verrucomicrobiota bacterium]
MQSLNGMNSIAFIQGLGTSELFIILIIVLVLFGAKRLPELAKGLGKSVKEFKKATQDVEEDIRTAMDEKPVVKNPTSDQNSSNTVAKN